MNGAMGLVASTSGLSRHIYERTQKDQKTSLRVAGIPSDIQTRHLPNTSLWPYVYSNWLVNITYMKQTVKCENNQQHASYRLIYYSRSALHVSGDVFAHRQYQYLTVFTQVAAGWCLE
jgi:hypothetical protein